MRRCSETGPPHNHQRPRSRRFKICSSSLSFFNLHFSLIPGYIPRQLRLFFILYSLKQFCLVILSFNSFFQFFAFFLDSTAEPKQRAWTFANKWVISGLLPSANPLSSANSARPVSAPSLRQMTWTDANTCTMATATITELDLNTCHPNPISNRINAVPGLKSSTAFFTFLRANLVLPPSAMSSNVSTPYLEPTTDHTLAPPSPSPLATDTTPSTATTPNQADDSDIPPLSLDILTEKDDKTAGLKLVADSIAQQRQQASSHLIFHPLNLSGLLASLAMARQLSLQKDLGTLTVLFCGIIMTYMLAIRYLTAPYIRFAEELNWSFLSSPDTDEEDIVLGTKFGGEVVGALVLRLEGAPSPKKKGRAGLKGGKGVIRAWTTRLRYRGKGVGGDLLREAVRITKERCGRDAEVGFAQEHANSRMVLPEMYNGVFRKREMRAAKALEGIVGEWDGRRKR